MARRKEEKVSVVRKVLMALRKHGWIGVLIIVCVLAISAIGSREAAHVETVAPVILPLENGKTLVTEDELLDRLAASFTKPMDLLTLGDIDITRVETVLEGQAFVANADAYVDDNMQLNIIITQRVPLLRIVAESGQNYYLDEDGIRMPLSETYTARVPVVTGNVALWQDDLMDHPDHQLYQLVALANYLREDDFLDALIEQIYVNTKGEFILAPKVGDQVIYLGRYRPELTQERLQRLKTFYREGLPYEGWRKYKSFDLRYADQVVAKKR